MRSAARLLCLALVVATCGACAAASRGGPPPIGADGVGLCPGSVLDSLQVADVVISDTTASVWELRRLSDGRGPRYPRTATDPYIEAEVVASFIVDTTGAVVPRSGTIDRARTWRNGPRSTTPAPIAAQEFAVAVCEYISQQRFAPVRLKAGGPPVRARLTVPFSFRVLGME
jgi:hypothetical protein